MNHSEQRSAARHKWQLRVTLSASNDAVVFTQRKMQCVQKDLEARRAILYRHLCLAMLRCAEGFIKSDFYVDIQQGRGLGNNNLPRQPLTQRNKSLSSRNPPVSPEPLNTAKYNVNTQLRHKVEQLTDNVRKTVNTSCALSASCLVTSDIKLPLA